MKCPRCQHVNPDQQKFCGDSGARLAAVCPACGAANPSGQKSCGECGATQSPVGETRSPAPASYAPKHLAAEVLTSPR